MKIKLGAVIPTVQYGNIQPEFEYDIDQMHPMNWAMADAEKRIQELWAKYGDRPLPINKDLVRLTDFFGNEIDYDPLKHEYWWEGERYLSGSEYAKQNQKPFDAVMMSAKVANKFNADPKAIAALWERSGKVSREFGSIAHEALEIYGKFKVLSDSVEKEYYVPNHPILKSIVESFYEGRGSDQAEYEVLVVDHKAQHAGTIDRLLITAPKTCVIQDFKIAHKESLEYWKDQLGFYKGIVEANGWKVLSKEIHQYNGEWRKIIV